MQPFVKLASKVQKPLGDMIHLQSKAAYRVDHWDCMLVYDGEGRDCSVTCLD